MSSIRNKYRRGGQTANTNNNNNKEEMGLTCSDWSVNNNHINIINRSVEISTTETPLKNVN